MATAVKNKRRSSRSAAATAERNGLIYRFLDDDGGIAVPSRVLDHEEYRRWATSDEYPDRGCISYLNGLVWVDLSMERAKHNQIKGAYDYGLTRLTRRSGLGRYFVDGMLVTNTKARLSTEPDGTYVSYESVQTNRVRLKEGDESLEVVGSPDMTLEVISTSSVEKDIELLFRLYWRAGIREYWLVDPRGAKVQFDIYLHGPKRYVKVFSRNGWVKSGVFGKAFRLSQKVGRDGLTDYRLEVR